MRPRKQILAELAQQADQAKRPNDMMPFWNIALLEVLLDIRDLSGRSRRQQAIISDDE